jgi:putative acetyltransferase
MQLWRIANVGVALFLLITGCSDSSPSNALTPDRTVVAASKYPIAVDVNRVGSYPALTKSGAGYFYDDVLEYRVWMKPEGGGSSFYRAFASFESALQFSKKTPRSEDPLVLIRQVQWIDEPEPGVFHPRSDERITEWQVIWLPDSKRSPDSISQFLREHQKQR